MDKTIGSAVVGVEASGRLRRELQGKLDTLPAASSLTKHCCKECQKKKKKGRVESRDSKLKEGIVYLNMENRA